MKHARLVPTVGDSVPFAPVFPALSYEARAFGVKTFRVEEIRFRNVLTQGNYVWKHVDSKKLRFETCRLGQFMFRNVSMIRGN